MVPDKVQRDPSVVYREDLETAVRGLKSSPEGQRLLQRFLQEVGLLPSGADIRATSPAPEEVLQRFYEVEARIRATAQETPEPQTGTHRDTTRADRRHNRIVQWIQIVLTSAALWFTVYPVETTPATQSTGQVTVAPETETVRPRPTETAPVPLQRHVISGTTNGLNLRAAPDTQALRLGALTEGSEVQVLTPGFEYSEILYLDHRGQAAKGYVLSKYLKLVPQDRP